MKYDRDSQPRVFNGEEIPSHWEMDWSHMARAVDIPAWTIVGFADPIIQNVGDSRTILVWDSSSIIQTNEERFKKKHAR